MSWHAVMGFGLLTGVWAELLRVLEDMPSVAQNEFEISMDYFDLQIGTATIKTRAMGGGIPGKVVRVQRGMNVKIAFTNNLEHQETSVEGITNGFQTPDKTNIHFHGLYAPSDSPCDNSLLVVAEGESYDYECPLLDTLMPGMSWIHPHKHGASNLQLGGGAAIPFITEDPEGYLNSQIESAPERIMVIHYWNMEDYLDVAADSGDEYAGIDDPDQIFNGTTPWTLNSQINPEIELTAGVWERWRILQAGWDDPHEFDLYLIYEAGCTIALLAKDGYYIEDYPRYMTEQMLFAPGGRADLMVCCPTLESSVTIPDFATVSVTGTGTCPDLDAWDQPERPTYLTSLLDADVTPGCSCVNQMGPRQAMNGEAWAYGKVMHTMFQGAVVERKITKLNHPWHNHVYPFQIYSMDSMEPGAFMQVGDKIDTHAGESVASTAYVRYQPYDWTGSILQHCHKADHSDRGMMGQEWVYPASYPVCQCTCEVVDNVGPPRRGPRGRRRLQDLEDGATTAPTTTSASTTTTFAIGNEYEPIEDGECVLSNSFSIVDVAAVEVEVYRADAKCAGTSTPVAGSNSRQTRTPEACGAYVQAQCTQKEFFMFYGRFCGCVDECIYTRDAVGQNIYRLVPEGEESYPEIALVAKGSVCNRKGTPVTNSLTDLTATPEKCAAQVQAECEYTGHFAWRYNKYCVCFDACDEMRTGPGWFTYSIAA